MNDEVIISSIKNQNETAISDVITKYSRLLWSVAGAVLNGIGSEQDIEECVADTFIFLWEHPEKFDPARGKLKSWLSVVARTRAVNCCREILRRDSIYLDDSRFADMLFDDMAALEDRRALTKAVNALSEPDREILIRRYYYEQKPREIAHALKISVKQVNNRLYRTKLKLREVLTE